MSVILILIAASLGMALLFLGGFIWAVRSGQFDDTLTPSMRVLTDESNGPAHPPHAISSPGQCPLPAAENAAPPSTTGLAPLRRGLFGHAE